ncbi:MAG: peptidase M8, partial [Anaerolineae bacterium]|nr:peptidase M8 [Anaerolineae bacterium]
MIKKLSQLIAISLMLVSLSACATAGIPAETSLPPTQVIIATSTPLTPTETPTSAPPTPTPIP